MCLTFYIIYGLCVSAGTPYAGGMFRIKLVLGKDFPAGPPKGFFLTKMFHPNVASSGEICVNTLKRDWKADYGVKHILLVSSLSLLLIRHLDTDAILYFYIVFRPSNVY